MTDKSHDPNQMTGAAMIVRALIDHGVEHLFGYPGGAVLPIYDEIFQQSEVEHILVRHEQGAGHAAEGYARSTGKVGVLLVTSGPASAQTASSDTSPVNLSNNINLANGTAAAKATVISGDRIALTPPASASLHSPLRRLRMAWWMATSDDEHAVSMAMAGPVEPSR